MDTATEGVVQMTKDLRPKDQAAADRIEYLEYQLDAADLTLTAVKRERDAAIDQVRRMQQDRECVD